MPSTLPRMPPAPPDDADRPRAGAAPAPDAAPDPPRAPHEAVVLDLDGTLIGAGGRVADADRAAVDRAREEGLRILVATGRALVECLDVVRTIDHHGPVITAGGSMMSDAATGHTLARHAMPIALVHEIAGALAGFGHKVLLLKDADACGYDYLAVGEPDLDPASAWWFEQLPVRVRFADRVDDDPDPDDTVRVAAVASGGELAPIARGLERDLGDRAFVQHWSAVTETEVVGSTTHLLEVFQPGVSKWTMIRRWCADHDVDPARTVAIGDGLNDVEMIREAGVGIAMSNADPRVLEVADRVTGHHHEHGVAIAIEHLLDGTW